MKKATRTPQQVTTALEHLEVRRLFASVTGVVFDDLNADGARQGAERGVANRRVFADLNGDGRRDRNEPSALTNARGAYTLSGVPTGKFTVRQVLPDASEQTSPAGVSGAFHVGPPAGSGLKINVLPGPNLQANRTALASVRAAAATWERYLTDDVTVNLDVELDDIGPPGTLGATTTTHAVLPYGQLRDALVAAATPDSAFVRGLPSLENLRYQLSPGGNPDDGPDNPFHFDGRVQVARANLLALGWSGDVLDTPPSAFDPSVTKIDASTSLNTAARFDYDPANGIGRGKADFFGTVLHEIGHALGFESTVDFVDFYRDNPYVDREVQPSALDLFRLAPGAGGRNFATATRVWAAGRDAPAQVFYDGGRYDPTGIRIAGLARGDVPFSTGVLAGDGQQPSHWKDDRKTRRNLGIFDPTIDAQIKRPGANDLRALDLIGWDVHQGLSGHVVHLATSKTVIGGKNFGVRRGDADDQVSEAIPAVPNAKARMFDLYRQQDVDMFSLRGRAGEKFGIDVDGMDPFDAYLRVLDAAGRQLAANDTAAAPGERRDGRSPYLEFTLPRDGTFFFSVSAKANTRFGVVTGDGDAAARPGWRKGYYTLAVVDRSGDGNNRIATAGVLTTNRRVTGTLAPADDVDLYRVTAAAGQRFQFDVRRPAGSPSDPMLRLFDAGGEELAWSDGNTRTADAATSLEYRFRTSGTYYVGVSAAGNVAYNPVTGTNRAPAGRGGACTLDARLFPVVRGASLELPIS